MVWNENKQIILNMINFELNKIINIHSQHKKIILSSDNILSLYLMSLIYHILSKHLKWCENILLNVSINFLS